MTVNVDPSIFRSYDIRGIVGETLTPAVVKLIGQAIGSMVIDAGAKEIVIARDGRLSGPELSKALSDGLMLAGCDVIDIGLTPTPILYFAAQQFEDHSGVMLTGSHNPANYNGLKTVIKGKHLSEEMIQAILQRIIKQELVSNPVGTYRQEDVTQVYLNTILENVQLKRPLKIVIDAGNGITGISAPTLFERLGCDVIPLFCEVDGHFPHHHPDPSQPENLKHLQAAVIEHQADAGLAFDGDGDRLGVVTSKGNVIWPDRLLMLFARSVLSKNPQANIIYDVKCTNNLGSLIEAHNGIPLMWKTGHSHIKAKLLETNALIAGEMSGHFFFNDRWFGFDDGLYAGARLVEILSETAEDSDSIFAAIPNSINTPELKVSVPDSEKFKVMEELIAKANFTDAKDMTTIDGLRVNFAEGWGLVRPSNTTPFLVLRFEAINESMLESIKDTFRDWIFSVRPDLVLPF